MKLTAHIKLQATPAHADTLLHTLQRANAACNAISADAWAGQTFNQFQLHRRLYQQIPSINKTVARRLRLSACSAPTLGTPTRSLRS